MKKDPMVSTPSLPLAVPVTLEQALDPAWLTRALAPASGGATVTGVRTVEVIRTMATKVRFEAAFEGGRTDAFCLKAFLDVDPANAAGGVVTILEADFYTRLAPRLPIRVPACVATVVDREAQLGVVIMRDLIADGARFCTALEPFTADDTAHSLEQLARLHQHPELLDQSPWVRRRVADMANSNYVTTTQLQSLLDGPRGEGLAPRIRHADTQVTALRALAETDLKRPATLIHGDCHAGNLYQTAEGPGLIDWQVLQRGGWALDVAYHITAVLPVEVAEQAERQLLDHYLATVGALGGEPPDRDQAWREYREALVWGYYLWSITRRVEPEIINTFVHRLGSAVDRHDSYRLLGLSTGP